MRKLTKLDKRFLSAISVTLVLAMAGHLLSIRNVQVFDLTMKDGILTPEWADNQHVSILRTELRANPFAAVGSSVTRITVSSVESLKVREKDSAPSDDCCGESECGGRWAAAMAADATDAVWWKQKKGWLPCFQYSSRGPLIISATNRQPTMELPGAALGTLPDGRLAYAATNLPGTNTANIDAWSPQIPDVQHLGKVHFPEGVQLFSARMSPNGNRICWLAYDWNASDTYWESTNRLARAFRKFTGKPFPATYVIAWLSNADGGNLHAVTRMQEFGFLMDKFIQDYDGYIGPTGDDIAWSCDSKFFAFIRGNPRGKRQLYVCRAD